MSFSIISGIVGSLSSLVSGNNNKRKRGGGEDEDGEESAGGASAPEKRVNKLKEAEGPEGDFKKELENIQKNVNNQILEIGEK
jgi:hypothetical protein